jgi:hypothetical protein
MVKNGANTAGIVYFRSAARTFSKDHSPFLERKNRRAKNQLQKPVNK